MIAICGADGSGKSTQAAMLTARLDESGVKAVRLWNRWTPWAVGAARAATRSVLSRQRVKSRDERSDELARAVATRPLLAEVFAMAAWLEYLVQTWWRLTRCAAGSDVVVVDRYVADMVVDRARRLHWSESRMRREINLAYRLGFPAPVLTVFLDAPFEALCQRRPDENPRALMERAELYRRLARALDAPVLEGTEPEACINEELWRLLESLPPGPKKP